MTTDPEVWISGRLRETLEDLRILLDDAFLRELIDAGQEHAPFHTLVDTGLRGLERYLTSEDGLMAEDAMIEPRGGYAPVVPGRNSRKRSGEMPGRMRGRSAVPAGEDGVELAERSLAVIDAALSSVALDPGYRSSLAVQEGLTLFRGQIRAALENLRRQDHRQTLGKLVEFLCRELRLRSTHSAGSGKGSLP